MKRGQRENCADAEQNGHLPLMAITMGDPAGIGSEVITKVASSDRFAIEHRAFVIGDAERITKEIHRNDLPLRAHIITRPEDCNPEVGVLHVLPASNLPPDLLYGRVDSRAGFAAFTYIRKAIEFANAGRVDGICTAPINKESLAAAGVTFPGHTEILAELSGVPDVAMMLVSPDLRVILVTIHCSLREAIDNLSIDAELRIIRLAHGALLRAGIASPRIAVAGLNPHASESGLFGREDLEIIVPAVRAAQAEGIAASGPHSGDTVFMQARRGQFDIVVAQYHDQGLIPIKLLGVEHGVNVTVGLPYIRTSPDHGTAFDIAGQGMANASSFRFALELARDMARDRASARHEGKKRRDIC